VTNGRSAEMARCPGRACRGRRRLTRLFTAIRAAHIEPHGRITGEIFACCGALGLTGRFQTGIGSHGGDGGSGAPNAVVHNMEFQCPDTFIRSVVEIAQSLFIAPVSMVEPPCGHVALHVHPPSLTDSS
jgi:hypothetical protein